MVLGIGSTVPLDLEAEYRFPVDVSFQLPDWSLPRPVASFLHQVIFERLSSFSQVELDHYQQLVPLKSPLLPLASFRNH